MEQKLDLVRTSCQDIAENVQYGSDAEDGCISREGFIASQNQPIPGILWFHNSPALTDVPHLSFSEVEVANRLKKCEKIFYIIENIFSPKNTNLFDGAVMAHWQQWLEYQQQVWCYSNFNNKVGDLLLPRPFSLRNALFNTAHTDTKVYDPAPADPDDDLEYVTHDSGPHGHFTTQQRTDLVRDLLLNEDANESSPILEKQYCIYKYEFNGNSNIMVGKVKAVHYKTNPMGEKTISGIEVLQCPKKGQKQDNLYVDISPDDSFNLDYRVRVVDMLERSMMLCFNLEMTSMGTFSKRRTSGRYSHSSYFVAHTQIQKFYEERNRAKSI